MKKVAVTGGISTGKSSVCHILKELGAYVVSADEIVHRLLVPETELGKKVVALLGQDIVVNKAIKRETIANKVFRNDNLLLALEKLLHPEVQKEIEAEYKRVLSSKHRLFVAEVPLLFEAHYEGYYDVILLVCCEEALAKKRMNDSREYERRSKRFASLKDKMEKSTFIIENNGTFAELKTHLTKIYSHLI